MKILSASQIREADQQTIKNEPIASIDLMERAVSKLFETIEQDFGSEDRFVIFCGKGNNGGDGLALARWLHRGDYFVQVVVVEHTRSGSEDFATNLYRLKELDVDILNISDISDIPTFNHETIIVDAMLGSGLSRPLKGLLAEIVTYLNKLPNEKIAIDIPTGLFADDNSENISGGIFQADTTLTFQSPKMAMLHRDTAKYAGQIEVLDIGLDKRFMDKAESREYYVSPDDIYEIFKPRSRFSYKGTFGHALLMAGSYGSMGAALMSGKAALRSGAGLLTAYIPACGVEIFQSSLPEAMVMGGSMSNEISGVPDFARYNALGIGPGIGTSSPTVETLRMVLESFEGKIVLDADALNILSSNPQWMELLSSKMILTPHIGEFKRLLGVDDLGKDYLEKLRAMSQNWNLIIILKDTITTIAAPDGNLYFMDYGTPALAKGGSGDVLTGIILGLLASGYEPLDAAKLGVYLQGIAANVAAEKTALESCLASDVIDSLGEAFRMLY